MNRAMRRRATRIGFGDPWEIICQRAEPGAGGGEPQGGGGGGPGGGSGNPDVAALLAEIRALRTEIPQAVAAEVSRQTSAITEPLRAMQAEREAARKADLERKKTALAAKGLDIAGMSPEQIDEAFAKFGKTEPGASGGQPQPGSGEPAVSNPELERLRFDMERLKQETAESKARREEAEKKAHEIEERAELQRRDMLLAQACAAPRVDAISPERTAAWAVKRLVKDPSVPDGWSYRMADGTLAPSIAEGLAREIGDHEKRATGTPGSGSGGGTVRASKTKLDELREADAAAEKAYHADPMNTRLQAAFSRAHAALLAEERRAKAEAK